MQRFLEPHGLRERGMCKDEEHVVRCSYIRYLAKTFHNDSVSQQADIEQIGLWNVRTTASRRATHLDFSQSLGGARLPLSAQLTQEPKTSVLRGLNEPR